MQWGVVSLSTDWSMPVTALARSVEERGFWALFLPEHTHIPVSDDDRYPLAGVAEGMDRRRLDPFVALAAAASVTTQLRIGTGICLVNQHHPITLAKTVATLDLVSGGRVILGVGAGWNEQEMRNLGVNAPLRWARMREHVLAMRAIWTDEQAEFHGSFVDFDPIWSYPKPLQRPHPPVWIGSDATSPATLRRVAEYGDAWCPAGPHLVGKAIAPLRAQLAELAAEFGRQAPPINVLSMGDPGVLRSLVDQGVDTIIVAILPGTASETLTALDRLRTMVDEQSAGR